MRTHAIDRLLRKARGGELISFAGGLPAPETFPREALASASREAALREGALQYDWPEGRQRLRAQIAAQLRARGAEVDASDVTVTSGAQDALSLAVEVLACREIEVEPVTYAGAIDLFTAHGITAVADRRAAVCYAMPAVHNPSGYAATPLQRAAWLSADWVIEDDAYADLRFDGAAPTPLLAEDRERVFHVGTVSKTLSPGLRIGWLVAPRRWQRAVREAKSRRDLQASGLSQAVAEQLLADGWSARLSLLRQHYATRCRRLLAALPRIPGASFTVPDGGFSLWLEADCPESDESFLRRALANGVAFDPGALFRVTQPQPGRLGLRLSFSSLPPSEFEAGVERLARTLEH